MKRRSKRPYQRKPWPFEARLEYFEIGHLASQIQAHILDIQEHGLNGARNYLLLPTLAPLIKNLASNIQVACRQYDSKRRRGFALWAGQAINEIDLLAAALSTAMDEAVAASRQPRNPYLVRFHIKDALDLVPRILSELQAGPPPPSEAEDPIADALDTAAEAWRNHDDDQG